MASDHATIAEKFQGIEEPKNFFPYAYCEVNGVHFYSFQPKNAGAPREFRVHVYKDGEKISEFVSRMYYPNIFGCDIDDVARLNETLEQQIKMMELE